MSDQQAEGGTSTRGEQAEAPIAGEDRPDDLERTETAPSDTDATPARGTGTDGDHDGDTHTDESPRQQDDEEHSEEHSREDDAQREQMQEEFAREHDPEKHDVSAGEEFRQEGDWTAQDAGGPQVWDSEGNLVAGSAPGASGASGHQTSSEAGGGGRTSSLDEVRDGGYGVGSAATLDDGATPLGHPVKAWEDSKTYVTPEHDKYGEADPHLWFTDADAAERAGFRPVD